MKTILMGFATIALLLASCSQNETFENEVSPVAVRFKNLNDRVHSRAANDNNSDYGVLAVLSGGNPAATDWFMNNQQVSGADDSYSPLKYWPATGAVDFYAYAPFNAVTLDRTGVSWNGGTPTFDIVYTVPTNGAQDFTVATPVVGATSANIQVALEFAHQLSKVAFQALLEQSYIDDGFAITLNSVSMKVAFNQGENTLENTTTAWTNLAANPAGNVVYTNATGYMIMPQPAAGTEITLNVTITHNGGPYLTAQNLQPITLTTANLIDFVKGTQYLFKATVGNTSTDENGDPVFNVIVFKSTLSPWITGGDIELTNP